MLQKYKQKQQICSPFKNIMKVIVQLYDQVSAKVQVDNFKKLVCLGHR